MNCSPHVELCGLPRGVRPLQVTFIRPQWASGHKACLHDDQYTENSFRSVMSQWHHQTSHVKSSVFGSGSGSGLEWNHNSVSSLDSSVWWSLIEPDNLSSQSHTVRLIMNWLLLSDRLKTHFSSFMRDESECSTVCFLCGGCVTFCFLLCD